MMAVYEHDRIFMFCISLPLTFFYYLFRTSFIFFFFFQAEDGIRDRNVTGVQTCALPIYPGGLWDESQNFYPRLGGTPHLRAQEWRWPRGGKIKFSHLQLRTTVHDWQGAQITLICFDELTHFTAHQFFYMVSRNRSTCGVRPYIRATCNPDADSWVAEFLAWWIDPETGLPIPERAGMLRYYVRIAGRIAWAERPEEW